MLRSTLCLLLALFVLTPTACDDGAGGDNPTPDTLETGEDTSTAGDTTAHSDADATEEPDAEDTTEADAEADTAEDATQEDTLPEQDTTMADVEPDVEPGPTCERYPVRFSPDPEAKERAEAAFAELGVGSLTWSDPRGTLQSLSGLDLPVTCADEDDAVGAAFGFAEAHPTLLQMDLTEWDRPAPIPCRVIAEGRNTTITVLRSKLGPAAVLRDTVAFTLRRIDGQVILRSVSGTYLPVLPEDVGEQLLACAALDTEAARTAVDRADLPYTLFDRCVRQGGDIYGAAPNDTLEFDPEPFALWDDGAPGEGVAITLNTFARLIIHPDNWTDDLLASDVNCPSPDGTERILGFRLTFDALNNTLVTILPGIGCIVC